MREKMIFLLSVILEINRVNIKVEAIYIYISLLKIILLYSRNKRQS